MHGVVPVIAIALWSGPSEAVKKIRARRPREVCAECAFVPMPYGAIGRNAVFGTFGDGLREVKLDVRYCTGCRNRNARARDWCRLDAPEMRMSRLRREVRRKSKSPLLVKPARSGSPLDSYARTFLLLTLRLPTCARNPRWHD